MNSPRFCQQYGQQVAISAGWVKSTGINPYKHALTPSARLRGRPQGQRTLAARLLLETRSGRVKKWTLVGRPVE